MNNNDWKRPLTLRELEAIVEDLDLNEENDIDICYIPPEVDDLTDEENIDEDVTGKLENLPVDLAGTFEIMHVANDGEFEENMLHDAALPLPKKRQGWKI